MEKEAIGNLLRKKNEITFRFHSISAVGYHKISEKGYVELNMGVCSVTEKNITDNEIKKNYQSYGAVGMLWKFNVINFRIGFSTQEAIFVGLGFHI